MQESHENIGIGHYESNGRGMKPKVRMIWSSGNLLVVGDRMKMRKEMSVEEMRQSGFKIYRLDSDTGELVKLTT